MTSVSTEFASILKKYERQKLNTYKVLEILGNDEDFTNYGTEEYKRYIAMLNCGTFLGFDKEVKEGSSVYHLRAANFCRQRVCPMCQFRKSEKMFVNVLRVVKHLEGQYRFLHLVLTVPNAENEQELLQGIKVLYKGFNLLLKSKEVKKAFKGALRCLEISYNYESNTFHPHLHCMIAVKPSYFNDSKVYISRDKITELWTKAVEKACKTLPYRPLSCNRFPLQTYITACKIGDYKGVAEVCKYSLKPLDLYDKGNDEQNERILLTLLHTLRGLRMVQKYGVIREAFKELGLTDEDEVTDDGNRRALFLQWDSSSLSYKEGGTI